MTIILTSALKKKQHETYRPVRILIQVEVARPEPDGIRQRYEHPAVEIHNIFKNMAANLPPLKTRQNLSSVLFNMK